MPTSSLPSLTASTLWRPQSQKSLAPTPSPARSKEGPQETGDRFDSPCEVASEDEIHPSWGARGHSLIQEVAVDTLPQAKLPEFFSKGKERIVGLASQPDRWKPSQLGYLKSASSLDHYFAYEQLKDILEFPADRYDFLSKVQEEKLGVPGAAPKYVGFLPYRVAELYQNLTLDFALWRKEGEHLPKDDPKRLALEENALTSAGLLGHYVEDACQPLHATVHHDGWNSKAAGGNPNNYREERGLHRQLETALVNANVKDEEIKKEVAAAKHWKGDPLQWGVGLIADSNAYVDKVYKLEQKGELDPAQPSQEAMDLVHSRMATGAQNLRDLWYSAWLDSKMLAWKLFPPQ